MPRAHINLEDDPKNPGAFDFQAIFEGGFQKHSNAHQHALILIKYMEKNCKTLEPAKKEFTTRQLTPEELQEQHPVVPRWLDRVRLNGFIGSGPVKRLKQFFFPTQEVN